jgi:hypothetical protein
MSETTTATMLVGLALVVLGFAVLRRLLPGGSPLRMPLLILRLILVAGLVIAAAVLGWWKL